MAVLRLEASLIRHIAGLYSSIATTTSLKITSLSKSKVTEYTKKLVIAARYNDL
jgi:hypothetical protein